MSGCDNCCKQQEENTQGKEVGTVTVGGRWGGKKISMFELRHRGLGGEIGRKGDEGKKLRNLGS